MSNIDIAGSCQGVIAAPDRPRRLDGTFGPGFITGAAADDPSGIATYSQAGALLGYSVGWTLLFSYPLMATMQLISAQIGRVSGKGIAGNMAAVFPKPLVYASIALLVIANLINLAADLGAMGAALQLLIGGPKIVYVPVFAAISIVLQGSLGYRRYVSLLKWLSLSLFAYVATVMLVHVSWRDFASGLTPQLAFTRESVTVLVAILGTTISPYLFFWQASSEAERTEQGSGAPSLSATSYEGRSEVSRIRRDTLIGMGISNLVALFILTSAAATLHATGITTIQSSTDAAAALRPIAGDFAFALFAFGIIGTGLLALPVLSASAAFAVGEVVGWNVGLARPPREAKAFYGTIAGAIFVAVCLNASSLDPITALFLSAIVNGLVAVPIMAMIMIIATRRAIMGSFVLSRSLAVLGWTATAVMALAAVGMFVA